MNNKRINNEKEEVQDSMNNGGFTIATFGIGSDDLESPFHNMDFDKQLGKREPALRGLTVHITKENNIAKGKRRFLIEEDGIYHERDYDAIEKGELCQIVDYTYDFSLMSNIKLIVFKITDTMIKGYPIAVTKSDIKNTIKYNMPIIKNDDGAYEVRELDHITNWEFDMTGDMYPRILAISDEEIELIRSKGNNIVYANGRNKEGYFIIVTDTKIVTLNSNGFCLNYVIDEGFNPNGKMLLRFDSCPDICEYEHKWYNKSSETKGDCYDCGLEYSKFPDLNIDDRLWKIINPKKAGSYGGLLCPTCIAKRLDYLGIWYNVFNSSMDNIKTLKEL